MISTIECCPVSVIASVTSVTSSTSIHVVSSLLSLRAYVRIESFVPFRLRFLMPRKKKKKVEPGQVSILLQ